MNIKTDGIILRETMTGEQDRLVTVLTRSNGVIKAFVNGARNPKNKNVSSTGLLCYSDFMINKSQKYRQMELRRYEKNLGLAAAIYFIYTVFVVEMLLFQRHTRVVHIKFRL